jgi:hypothetical protein
LSSVWRENGRRPSVNDLPQAASQTNPWRKAPQGGTET